MPIDLERIAQTFAEQRRQNAIYRIADKLNYELNINPELPLAAVLGDESAQSNRNALANWVNHELGTRDATQYQTCITELKRRLERLLSDLREAS